MLIKWMLGFNLASSVALLSLGAKAWMETRMVNNPPCPGGGLGDEAEALGVSGAAAEALGVTRQNSIAGSTATSALSPKWRRGWKWLLAAG